MLSTGESRKCCLQVAGGRQLATGIRKGGRQLQRSAAANDGRTAAHATSQPSAPGKTIESYMTKMRSLDNTFRTCVCTSRHRLLADSWALLHVNSQTSILVHASALWGAARAQGLCSLNKLSRSLFLSDVQAALHTDGSADGFSVGALRTGSAPALTPGSNGMYGSSPPQRGSFAPPPGTEFEC